MGGKSGKYEPRPCGYRESEAFEELGEGQCGCSRKNKEERHKLALNFSSGQQETLKGCELLRGECVHVGWEVDSGLNRFAPQDPSDHSRRRCQGPEGRLGGEQEATAGIPGRDAEAWTRLVAQSWRGAKGSIRGIDPAGLEAWRGLVFIE